MLQTMQQIRREVVGELHLTTSPGVPAQGEGAPEPRQREVTGAQGELFWQEGLPGPGELDMPKVGQGVIESHATARTASVRLAIEVRRNYRS